MQNYLRHVLAPYTYRPPASLEMSARRSQQPHNCTDTITISPALIMSPAPPVTADLKSRTAIGKFFFFFFFAFQETLPSRFHNPVSKRAAYSQLKPTEEIFQLATTYRNFLLLAKKACDGNISLAARIGGKARAAITVLILM